MRGYRLPNSFRDTGKTQYRPPPIKHSNLNKKAAPPSVCRAFFYYEPFFSGQLGIKRGSPLRVAAYATPFDLRRFCSAICEEGILFKLGLFGCLLKSLKTFEYYYCFPILKKYTKTRKAI